MAPLFHRAAIIKSSFLRNGLSDRNEVWQNDAHADCEPQQYLKVWTFYKSKMTDGRYFKNLKWPFLRNGSSYRNEIWQDDAHADSETHQLLKFHF